MAAKEPFESLTEVAQQTAEQITEQTKTIVEICTKAAQDMTKRSP